MASNGLRSASFNISSRLEIPSLQSPRTPSSNSFHDNLNLDPLLADLSPSSVLEAFRNADDPAQISNLRARPLASSIAEASAHERALGIRAALAGKRARDWVVELQQWNWPNEAFETPTDNRQHIYWGSLHSQVVLERDERLRIIKEGLALLETEDLKNHVRNIHMRRRSKTPESPGSPQSPASVSYDHLADFHVIVTSIITKTLPELMTLSRMMGDWSVRIFVLKRVSIFHQQLRDAKLALESAWTTVEQATKTGNGLILTRSTYEQIKHILETRVTSLAKTIDTMLDTLEGHKDRIPDQWIDNVEEVESDYNNWVIEAERLVRLYEWQTSETRLEAAITAALSDSTGELNSEDNTDIVSLRVSEGDGLVTVTEDKHITAQLPQDFEDLPVGSNTDFMTRPTHNHKVIANGSILPTKDVAQELNSTFGLLPPISLEHKGDIEVINDSNTFETSLPSESSTRIGFSKAEQLHITPSKFEKTHRRADSSPLDINYALFNGGVHEDVVLGDTGKDTIPLLSRNRAISDSASYQHHMESSTASIGNLESSLPSGIAGEPGDDLSPAKNQHSILELSPQSQSEKAQQELENDAESLTIGNASPSLMVRKVRLQNNSTNSTQLTDDKITAKISRLLKKIPAPIQLTDHSSQSSTGPGTEGKSSVRSQQQAPPPAGLTLSPVASKTKNTQLNDLGVRVYHLHQSGREVPIKLFIRLVGTEERVMVRVGGGWADLAEYLKEYAIHHGRRSVSNNNFELAGSSPAKAAANSIFNAARSPTSSSTTTTPAHRPVTPSSSLTKESFASEFIAPTESPDLSQFHRSRARSASPLQEDEISVLGLGGPKSKNIELSPQKRAWVDGMLGQARQLSSEHRKIDEIGDLGKVGSTKRVFLRAAGDSSASK